VDAVGGAVRTVRPRSAGVPLTCRSGAGGARVVIGRVGGSSGVDGRGCDAPCKAGRWQRPPRRHDRLSLPGGDTGRWWLGPTHPCVSFQEVKGLTHVEVWLSRQEWKWAALLGPSVLAGWVSAARTGSCCHVCSRSSQGCLCLLSHLIGRKKKLRSSSSPVTRATNMNALSQQKKPARIHSYFTRRSWLTVLYNLC
jgi:hypothetical protein